MTVRVLIGDCRARLAELPAESVHCVVTSPPYFGLRDYKVDGQIGLEATPDAYVAELVAVFREVRRVLRDDGTVWLNIGDSYANGGGLTHTARDKGNGRFLETRGMQGSAASRGGIVRPMTACNGLKPKDLIGIPWRVAFALQADGWYLRQDIIWAKPNPMPESVQDRCTKSHEYVFLLSKQERYWYDADSIKDDGSLRKSGNTQHKYVNEQQLHRTKAGFLAMRANVYEKTNRRSVWTIATQPFGESHFATMPPALAELCIKAGCPAGGTVLDPFGGAGTTGMVAARLLRDGILIELNPDYANMVKRRIYDDFGLFTPIHLEHVVEAAE
jgi:DNA modification methylase